MNVDSRLGSKGGAKRASCGGRVVSGVPADSAAMAPASPNCLHPKFQSLVAFSAAASSTPGAGEKTAAPWRWKHYK